MLLCLTHDIEFDAKHISRKLNSLPDAISSFQDIDGLLHMHGMLEVLTHFQEEDAAELCMVRDQFFSGGFCFVNSRSVCKY